MFLIFLCCEHGGDELIKTCKELNINYHAVSAQSIKSAEGKLSAMAEITRQERTAVLYMDSGMDKNSEEFYTGISDAVMKIPLGSDAIMLGNHNINGKDVETINKYIIYGGIQNQKNVVKYIAKYIFDEYESAVDSPDEIPFSGIYSPYNDKVYSKLSDFLADSDKYNSYVGILSHRSSWIKSDNDIEKTIAKELNHRGIGTVCVFSYGESNGEIKSYDFSGIVSEYFSVDGELRIDMLINFQMFLFRLKGAASLSEQSVLEFSKLNIPILNPINSYYLTMKSWREKINPLVQDMSHALINSELSGMIEPILVGVFENGRHIPIPERINYLCSRAEKYIKLRHKANADKKIAVMLHNSVCSGVEATIGKAFGLDAFESVIKIMRRLSDEGYTVTNIPSNGKELMDLILDRQAISDFRWTSVESIEAHGGILYRMNTACEYMVYFDELPESQRDYMNEIWGKAPGQGMVIGDDIIITGLNFGNVNVMIQPKRGCYGAKCTGEVCKILHDPACPPPHQYLATYRFIERIFGADAVIHTGTDGSLEYLPGKSNALTESCWSNIVLGTLPNIYLYNAGVPSEAMTAKRRTNAVITDYLPPSSVGLTCEMRELIQKIDEYSSAVELQNGHEAELKAEIDTMLSKFTDETPNIADIREYAINSAMAGKIGTRQHIFGEIPDIGECINYILEIWLVDNIIPRDDGEDDYNYRERVRLIISNEYSEDAAEIMRLLQCTGNEMESLINALNGGYVAAGESGMPDENGRKILPTGRNMFSVNTDKIPTRTAYKRGIILAEQLLEQYIKDENRYPNKIAVNMISVDITRTQGEQLSQVLYLLGVRPVWDNLNRVVSLEVIPLDELNRPRIDVTVRISGVMRDTWPHAVDMMDDAVIMVSALDESDGDNFVRANISGMEHEHIDISERGKTIRIFGDPPGTYGAGVDLALKASAWKNDDDLARYFIASSSFAYGNDLSGRKSIREFIHNAKSVDLTSDTMSSRRMDTLACGFGLEVQGGYRLVAKTLGKKNIRQYHSNNELNRDISTNDLAAQISQDINDTLLNMFWKQNCMDSGYDGASDIMHRIQNVFETQCLNDTVSDEMLNEITDKYVNNEAMRAWFAENNKYAIEEIARRLLELYSRDKWKPDTDILQELQMNYLSIEGDMESGLNGLGEIQAGNVDIIADDKVELWKKNLADIDKYYE